MRRLSGKGAALDHGTPLNFTFDGTAYEGQKGDTLASALLANGVKVVGRSFKYHRPRGIWGAWVDEPNAIMSVTLNGTELPNCLATTTYLEDGMEARAVNAWPSARRDVKGALDLFSRFLGAGFYYKTFIWPDWHLFEPSIRKMAGLGAVTPDHLDSYTSDQTHENCDTLVIGGGPAGLLAARTAAEAGQSVMLVDDQAMLGGTAYQFDQIDGHPPKDWVIAQTDAIRTAGGRILTQTTAYGVYDHNLVALVEQGPFGTAPRLWRIRTTRTILATGAIDRPITFAGNDKPGVMSLFAAHEYLARYGLLPETAIALANSTLADHTLQTLEANGTTLTRLDPATPGLTSKGWQVTNGIATGDRHHPAETILASAGLTPLVHLWRHAGGKLTWDEARQAFLPDGNLITMQAIGAANGTFDIDAALEEARAAAAGNRIARGDTRHTVTPLWPTPGTRGRQWIDFQHDVTLKDIELAARENYTSVEHLKRYTTLGMASDQGKTSNMAGLAAMATLNNTTIPETGTTTFRPPFVPVPLATYHGQGQRQLYHPIKRLKLEPQHCAADAALCEYGGWLRPGWYGSGDRDTNIAREARMARDTAGVLDGSPLGKIEVMGPDAEAFVNFMFYNTMKTLKVGHIRYGFLLTEGGIVYDDGVVARLAPDRFLISCSSSHVDGVRGLLETWRQDGNDPDRIFIHDLTMQWATVTVTGPKARDILGTLTLNTDLSRDALPFMTFAETTWNDAPMRIARVSFSGDLSYEMSVPQSQAPALWDAALTAVTEVGGGPLGIEAMSILRAEKGYIMVGKDTDGETMPHDLGFTAPRLKKTAAFVGDRSLHTEKGNAPDRKQLVGLTVPQGHPPLATGAHAVSDDTPRRSLGYVTSSYYSPSLGHPIALGLIENGRARIGEDITIWHAEELRRATIVAPCFFDAEGERLHA